MFPGKKMLKRVNKIFPNIKDTVLLNDSKHVPNQDDLYLIENHILKSL